MQREMEIPIIINGQKMKDVFDCKSNDGMDEINAVYMSKGNVME